MQDHYEALDCGLVPSISAEEFQILLESQQSILVLDVRTPEEFSRQHLNESINVPLGQLESASEHVDGVEEVYVICQSGKRSEQAIQQLEPIYPTKRFYNVLGGMNKMKTLCP